MLKTFKGALTIVICGLILLSATSYFFFVRNAPEPAEYKPPGLNQRVIYIKNIPLNVEIADEPHEQSLGLSYRTELSYNNGMLFIFPVPARPGFWMKDMNFALDLLWISSEGIITKITPNLSPDTYPQTFSPDSDIKYVLEVNAGWSEDNNVRAGDSVLF